MTNPEPNRSIPAEYLPDHLVEAIETERRVIIERLLAYDENVAVNIIHNAFIAFLYRAIPDKEERERAFEALERGRLISYKAWNEEEREKE